MRRQFCTKKSFKLRGIDHDFFHRSIHNPDNSPSKMVKVWCFEPWYDGILHWNVINEARSCPTSLVQQAVQEKYGWKLIEMPCFKHTNGAYYMLLMNENGFNEDIDYNAFATKHLMRIRLNWGIRPNLTGAYVAVKYRDDQNTFEDMDITLEEFIDGFNKSLISMRQ